MRLNPIEVKILIPQMKKFRITLKCKVTPEELSYYNLEGQSTTKRKLVVQPPRHLPERIS